MSDTSFEKSLTMKPALTQARKIGGRVIIEELEVPTFDEEEALDTLLDGVNSEEIEEGSDRLMAENPRLASEGVRAMFGIDASDVSRAAEFTNPVREAGVKRAGKIALRETGDTLNFRRTNAGKLVELSSDEGEVIETLSSLEFDSLLGGNEYIVL